MKNEMTSQQIFKKKQIFIVKEKIRKKKSKTLSSPITRQRRHTEPSLTELGRLKKSLRTNQENISNQRNQVPPYTLSNRSRAVTSIPNSYQHQNHHQLPQRQNQSGLFEQIATTPYQNNNGYQSYQQQVPNNQQNYHNSYPSHNIHHQSSSSSSSTQLTSSSITSPTQSSAIYNNPNQRNSQQVQQHQLNVQSPGVNGYSKNYPIQSNMQGNYIQNIQQGAPIPNMNTHNIYENNSVKKIATNGNSPYVKQNNSITNNSMSSSSTNQYMNSSQNIHPNSYNGQDKPHQYGTSAPTFQKSNSWMVGDQRYPESNISYNEPPLYHAQSSASQYGNQNEINNKYNNQYNPSMREYSNSTGYLQNNNKMYAKGNYSHPSASMSNYPQNIENYQIQNTPSTIASRTSNHSPHNVGAIDSFEHGQNLYRSQSEHLEQELQDFQIDSHKANDQDIEDNYYKDSDQYMNNNQYNEDELSNFFTSTYNNNANNFANSNINNPNYNSEFNQFDVYN